MENACNVVTFITERYPLTTELSHSPKLPLIGEKLWEKTLAKGGNAVVEGKKTRLVTEMKHAVIKQLKERHVSTLIL